MNSTFRPCIDVRNGKVVQIIGESLIVENRINIRYISDHDITEFAKTLKHRGVKGAHICILNKCGTPEYEESKQAVFRALKEYPKAFHVGGGITSIKDVKDFIKAGADKVIVSTFIFKEDGTVDYDKLDDLVNAVGAKNLVIDLSCKKVGNEYFVATHQWTTVTKTKVETFLFQDLHDCCDEFLIHSVDAEGKLNGYDEDLLIEIIKYRNTSDSKFVTYAGGISNLSEVERLIYLTQHKVGFTIGSALKLFGGTIKYDDILEIENQKVAKPKLIKRKRNGAYSYKCPICGYKEDSEFYYCPDCRTDLDKALEDLGF